MDSGISKSIKANDDIKPISSDKLYDILALLDKFIDNIKESWRLETGVENDQKIKLEDFDFIKILEVEDFFVKIEQEELNFNESSSNLKRIFDSINCCISGCSSKAECAAKKENEKYHYYCYPHYDENKEESKEVQILTFNKYDEKLKDLEKLTIFVQVILKHFDDRETKKDFESYSQIKKELNNEENYLRMSLKRISVALNENNVKKSQIESLESFCVEYNKCREYISMIYLKICESLFLPRVLKLIDSLMSTFAPEDFKNKKDGYCTALYGKEIKLCITPITVYNKLDSYNKDVEKLCRSLKQLEKSKSDIADIIIKAKEHILLDSENKVIDKTSLISNSNRLMNQAKMSIKDKRSASSHSSQSSLNRNPIIQQNDILQPEYCTRREERKETDKLEDQEENKLNKLNEGIIKGQELDPLSIGKLNLNEQRFENLEKKLNRLK